eukprot:gene8613-8794_t
MLERADIMITSISSRPGLIIKTTHCIGLLLCAVLVLLPTGTHCAGGWPRYDRNTYRREYPGKPAVGNSWKGRNNWKPQGYYWPSAYSCGYHGCFQPCQNPAPISAWDYISSTPELSFLTSLLKGTVYQAVLEGPFNGTLLALNNEAFDTYYMSLPPQLLMVLDSDRTRTGPAWKQVNQYFWPPLLSYHVLPEAVYAKDFKAGKWYSTMHSHTNGEPHKVYFGAKNVPVVYGRTVSKYAPVCSECGTTNFYWMSEQNKVVTMSKADKWVIGGGVVHTVAQMLEANDMFPSLQAKLSLLKTPPEARARKSSNTLQTSWLEGTSFLESVVESDYRDYSNWLNNPGAPYSWSPFWGRRLSSLEGMAASSKSSNDTSIIVVVPSDQAWGSFTGQWKEYTTINPQAGIMSPNYLDDVAAGFILTGGVQKEAGVVEYSTFLNVFQPDASAFVRISWASEWGRRTTVKNRRRQTVTFLPDEPGRTADIIEQSISNFPFGSTIAISGPVISFLPLGE